MAAHELSPDDAALATGAAEAEAAAARKRGQARGAQVTSSAHYVVSTTTHGKLLSPDVELRDGWALINAPIIAVDTTGAETDMAVQSLAIPSSAVRQVVLEA